MSDQLLCPIAIIFNQIPRRLLASLFYNLANRTYLRGIELGSVVVAPSSLLFSLLLLPAAC